MATQSVMYTAATQQIHNTVFSQTIYITNKSTTILEIVEMSMFLPPK